MPDRLADTDAPQAPLAPPLHDLRILAVEQFAAGPWCTMQLADLGADVIKLEDPHVGGDVGRYVPPYQEGQHSLYFESFNRNKRSIALDLHNPATRPVLMDLARSVDVIFSNLRGDQPERLGLRFSQLESVNPKLVCCSLSGFGTTGPRAAEGGYDHSIQGMAGWQSLTGEAGGPPVKSGLSLVDFSAGYAAAIAIISAAWRARRDGRGGDIDLSLFETALAELSYLATWVASRDYQPIRQTQSAHQSLVPLQNFETADGWIVVACPKESLWVRLCEALGRPELADDRRFHSFPARLANRETLLEILYAAFRSRSTSDWLTTLGDAGVPCSPIQDVAHAIREPQLVARRGLPEYAHPILGVVKQPASPFVISEFEPPLRRAPFLGEHTTEVLRDLLGYEDEQITSLKNAGIFGSNLSHHQEHAS